MDKEKVISPFKGASQCFVISFLDPNSFVEDIHLSFAASRVAVSWRHGRLVARTPAACARAL